MKESRHNRLHIIWFHLYEMPIRIDSFKLRCWQRLLRVPWAARRSNQSILKEINTEYLLEALTLKLQDFGHLIWRANSLEKILMLEKIEGKRKGGHRGWDGWMASLFQWTWVWANSGRHWKRERSLVRCSSWGRQEQQQQGAVERWKWELTAIGHVVSFVIIKIV